MTKSILHTVYLCLGTNLGDKQSNLDLAIAHITDQCGEVKRESAVYKSPAWGYESKNEYFNQCLKIETHLTPNQLIDIMLLIEREMGRPDASITYADRMIDIDVLFFDDMVINKDKLVVPHARIAERRFVLAPMTELAPGLIHPLLGKTVKVLLDDCKDKGNVVRIPK